MISTAFADEIHTSASLVAYFFFMLLSVQRYIIFIAINFYIVILYT